MKLGILSAMKEEFDLLLKEVQNPNTTTLGMREYVQGILFGREVVLVFSQWGKTASASTTANLINVFGVKQLIFTGVAGGLSSEANIGDIVIAKRLYHHDVDASPFKKRYYVPLVGSDGIGADEKLSDELTLATEKFVSDMQRYISKENIEDFSLSQVKIHRKNIATGDQFVKTQDVTDRIINDLPNMYAVEMEGAAVAQVCWEHNVPFAVMRTISDSANEHSPLDYPKFLDKVASVYSLYILKNYIQNYS